MKYVRGLLQREKGSLGSMQHGTACRSCDDHLSLALGRGATGAMQLRLPQMYHTPHAYPVTYPGSLTSSHS